MLTIRDLTVTVQGNVILDQLNLSIHSGEVHAIMGPNGSGKSTLANALAGREDYQVEQGDILYQGKSLLDLSIEQRAQAGLFLALQYPVEIPGVSNIHFLKEAVNAVRQARGQDAFMAPEFMRLAKQHIAEMGMEPDLLYRSVNEGFSGGEKKRNDILQMLMLEPCLAILDETDSGLDIDALQLVASGVNSLRSQQRSFLVITHYQRLLNYIVPDYVHVLSGGKIVRSGGCELAEQLEREGYVGLSEA